MSLTECIYHGSLETSRSIPSHELPILLPYSQEPAMRPFPGAVEFSLHTHAYHFIKVTFNIIS